MKILFFLIVTALYLNPKVIAQFTYSDSLIYEFDQAIEYHSDTNNLPNDSILFYNLLYEGEQQIERIAPYENLRFLLGVNETFPLEYLCNFKYLKNLEIRTNSSIPNCFKDLQDLVFLRLELIRDKKLPDIVGQLQNLKILIVSLSKLEKAEGVLGDLKNLEKLKTLRLVIPKLREFPAAIFELNSLYELSFDYLNYLVLSEDILKLDKLRLLGLPLDISNIRNLEILSKMKSLKRLEVYPKKLKKVPSELTKLSFLEELVIRNDKLNFNQQSRIRKLLPNTKIIFSFTRYK